MSTTRVGISFILPSFSALLCQPTAPSGTSLLSLPLTRAVFVNPPLIQMATHHTPQSLPSFAQAFSPSSLNNITSSSNSLPPIQPRPSFERFRHKDTPSSRDQSRHPSVERTPSQSNGQKRSREDTSSGSNSGSE